MGTEVKANYNCTQAELYSICRLGWSMCSSKQTQLVVKFPFYISAYIAAAIAKIPVAESKPGFAARGLVPETAHTLLKQLAKPATENWDLLERYIIHAFQSNKDLIETNVEAAGKDYHEAATRENPNWEDLRQMLVAGQQYISGHTGILAPYMPVSFPADFDATANAFYTQYDIYLPAKTETPAETEDKILANNELHSDLMLMLGDLKFVQPAGLERQATFTYLKQIVSSPGPAGLKGKIISITNADLPGTHIRLDELDLEVIADVNSEYDFGNIPAGVYTLIVSLSGYQTVTFQVTIDTGVTSTKNFQLAPNP